MNPYSETDDRPKWHMAALQKVFFACPNLTSFALYVYGNYGGCVRRSPRHPLIHTFQLNGEEKFPPLVSLSLDGYQMQSSQWVHWRDKLDWHILTSLSLGPTLNPGMLEVLTGVATHLRALKVETWAREGRDDCPELEDFLRSFDTLEQLTVRGHFASKRALCNHAGLRRLCLHSVELPRDGARRPVLDVAGLKELDAKCPDLETLEIDIYRDKSNGWVSTQPYHKGSTHLT